MSKRGLGRGLQALLPDIGKEEAAEGNIIEVVVDDIKQNRKQPRKKFDEEKLKELAMSIKEHGVVQPVLLRALKDGEYELVAGERRLRACKIIGAKKIPAIVKEIDEKKISEIALIENIQREDLNPIEEAEAYRTLMEEHDITQDELSRKVGKSRPFIANTVRLLSLPEKVRDMVVQGILSAGHARTLLGIAGEKEIEEIAQVIAKRGLSVRQTEEAVKGLTRKVNRRPIKEKEENPVMLSLEEDLRRKFSTKVNIRRGKKGGRIEIEYYGEDELQRILEILLEYTDM
ncbi:MAG: chromosome partitioning protein ParB [Firmicutes bacterium HGW-Firmicutes-14]|nr:MAG: chromosome partitioning protein ParB [Firmicutes bacterium HGW-Firmicutes-14]